MSSIRRSALCILFALPFAQTLPGQQQAPRLAPVGTSYPTQVNAPFLRIDNAPLLGEPLRLDLMGGEPQQFGFLGLGFPSNSPVVMPTGHPIYIPNPQILTLFQLDAHGEGVGIAQSPPLPAAALGVDLAAQAVVFDPGIAPGFISTKALEYRLASPVPGPTLGVTAIDTSGSPQDRIAQLMDFDGDGIREVLGFRRIPQAPSRGTLFLQQIDGSGSYGAAQPLQFQNPPVYDQSRGAAAGDVTSDGIPDVVVANGQTGQLLILAGNGDLTFQAPVVITGFGFPSACVVVDREGDGDLDIGVVDSIPNAPFAAYWLLNDGTGSFSPRQLVGSGPAKSGESRVILHAADLDGDGIQDLVVDHGDQWVGVVPTLEVFRSTLAGNALGSQQLFPPRTVETLRIEDMDGDGLPDFVAAFNPNSNASPPSALVYWNDGIAGFTSNSNTFIAYTPTFPGGAIVADMIGSPLPDILCSVVSTSYSRTSVLRLFENLGNRTFASAGEQVSFAKWAPTLVEPGGGVEPFAWFHRGNHPTRVALDANGLPLAPVASPVPAPSPTVSPGGNYLRLVGDLDLDGLPDAVVEVYDSYAYTTSMSWLKGNGDGSFGSLAPIGTFPGAPEAYRRVDINKDGGTDLLFTTDTTAHSGPATVIGVICSSPSGPQIWIDNVEAQVIDAADLDRDGHVDLFVAGLYGGGYYVYPGLGDGTFGPRTFTPLSDWITAARLVDMNLDGLVDLVNLTQTKLQVRLASPAGGFMAPKEVTPADLTTYYGLPIADQDGDGYPDVVTAHDWPTFAEFWRNDGTGGLLPSVNMPNPTNIRDIQFSDLDQDGTPELFITTGYEFMVIRDMTPQGPMTAERLPSLQIDTQPFFVDVDLDGLVDLVAMNTAVGEAILTFRNQRGGRK